jgi:TonB family protein
VVVHLGLVALVLGAVHQVRGALPRLAAPPAKVAHAPAWTRVSILPSSHRHEAPAQAPAVASARVAPARTLHRPTTFTTEGTTAPERGVALIGEADGPAPDGAPGTAALAAPTSAPPSDGPGPATAVPAPVIDVTGPLHERLVAAAARCYPATARRFHQTGEVTVGFCLDVTGGLARAEVRRPSGVPSLDAATLECVLPEAAPFPRAASGQCFEVPVRFGLK